MEPSKTFIIKRSGWYRGQGGGTSGLLVSFNPRQQCCIGVFMTHLGVADVELRDQSAAEDLKDVLPDEAKWLVDHHHRDNQSPLAKAMYSINDNENMTDTLREELLTNLFASQGWTVYFE